MRRYSLIVVLLALILSLILPALARAEEPPVLFSYAGNPLLVTKNSLMALYVHGGQYRMYVLEDNAAGTYPADFNADLMISPDGLNWNVPLNRGVVSKALTDKTFNYYAGEVLEGGVYKMWHTATNDYNIRWMSLYHSISTDGVSFTPHGPVLPHSDYPQNAWGSNSIYVIKHGELYYLYYTVATAWSNRGGNFRIAVATSPDGYNWTRHGIAVDLGEAGSYDDRLVHIPIVLHDGMRFEMFYMTANARDEERLAAMAVSYDGINWTKLGPLTSLTTNKVLGVRKEGGKYRIWHAVRVDTDWRLCYAESSRPPVADAGENRDIGWDQQAATVIAGAASDPDGEALEYRWLERSQDAEGNPVDTVLKDWSPVGGDGAAPLALADLGPLPLGQYSLVLAVSDGFQTTEDQMLLTIDNSSPEAALTGAGTYELGAMVTLGGTALDYDGDTLAYQWLWGETVLVQGSLATMVGGDPVDLPGLSLDSADLGLGSHEIRLILADGVNPAVVKALTLVVQDTAAPTLAPVADPALLWPPDHEMVPVVITANASDNSGGAVTLAVVVGSNEPEDGLGDGETEYDWSEPVIDQESGRVSLSLRAERSGSGDGRTYTVTITATDASGNLSSVPVEIIVPHDRGKQK